jgi:hypothetical protein
VDDFWEEVSSEAISVCSDCWVVFSAGHPKKLHSGRVTMPCEMSPMYNQDSNFQAPKVDGLLPHFLVLHRMMRKTLAPRIGYSEAIPTYERNLLDALMKPMCFDVFQYVVDDIWNIATNPLISCGFAP